MKDDMFKKVLSGANDRFYRHGLYRSKPTPKCILKAEKKGLKAAKYFLSYELTDFKKISDSDYQRLLDYVFGYCRRGKEFDRTLEWITVMNDIRIYLKSLRKPVDNIIFVPPS